jgi:hypothetical protein
VAIIGRMNEDFTFETCEKKTAEEVGRERVITIMVVILTIFSIVGIPTLVNLGKAIFHVEPIIY